MAVQNLRKAPKRGRHRPWGLIRGLYRGPAEDDPAQQSLASAAEALSLASLALSSESGSSMGAKYTRSEQCRAFLVEAVRALSRARIHHPKIVSLSVAVVMAAQPTLDAELLRLHQITTRLIWKNHEYLPARPEARPLTAEEEAQLADLLASVRRSSRLAGLSRFRHVSALAAMSALALTLGLPLVALAAAGTGVMLGTWQTLGGESQQPLRLRPL